jgi:hypothetical protein
VLVTKYFEPSNISFEVGFIILDFFYKTITSWLLFQAINTV